MIKSNTQRAYITNGSRKSYNFMEEDGKTSEVRVCTRLPKNGEYYYNKLLQLSVQHSQKFLLTWSSQNFAKWSRKLNFTLVFACNKNVLILIITIIISSIGPTGTGHIFPLAHSNSIDVCVLYIVNLYKDCTYKMMIYNCLQHLIHSFTFNTRWANLGVSIETSPCGFMGTITIQVVYLA